MTFICPFCKASLYIDFDGYWAHPGGLWIASAHAAEVLPVEDADNFYVCNSALPFEVEVINNYGDME